MPYLNMDDNYPEHPKVEQLSDGAFRLHTSGLAYCAKHTTDGFIYATKAPRLIPRFRPSYIRELLDSHPERPLWAEVPGGYLIHDYLQWNKSRAWWNEKREKDAKRKAEWRKKNEGTDGGGTT